MAYQIPLPTITTTGTTPGFLDLLPITQGTCVTLAGNIICISSGGLVRAWDVIRTGKWLVGGSPVLVGTAPTATIESDASFAPSVALVMGGTDGNLVRIQCTGLASTTISWTGLIRAVELSKP